MPAQVASRRRVSSVALGVTALLQVAGLLLLVLRPWERRATAIVSTFTLQQIDQTYDVEDVTAVVDGDHDVLRLDVRWPGDPRDGAAIHTTADLTAQVWHEAPYTALITSCGAPAAERETASGLELDCTGRLVPDRVRQVDLREVVPGTG